MSTDSQHLLSFSSQNVGFINLLQTPIQVLIRLEMSFRGSFLELSKWTVWTLRTLVAVIPISSTIVLISDDHNLDCLQKWNPPDLDRTLWICRVPPQSLRMMKYHIMEGIVLLINALNITFGVIFTLKLRQFVKLRKESGVTPKTKAKQCKFQNLILKNDSLSVCK